MTQPVTERLREGECPRCGQPTDAPGPCTACLAAGGAEVPVAGPGPARVGLVQAADLLADQRKHPAYGHGLPVRLVNIATWTEPFDPELILSGRRLVANAPRPLAGDPCWEGDFRHGRHYAAAEAVPDALFGGWRRDDGHLIAFTDNAQVTAAILAYAEKEYGFTPARLAEEGITVEDIAAGHPEWPLVTGGGA